MSTNNKSLGFYRGRLYELRDLLNIVYNRCREKNIEPAKIIRQKFDDTIIKHNLKILLESITEKNLKSYNYIYNYNPNYIKSYVNLCNKYINILKLIYNKTDDVGLLLDLRLESLKIIHEENKNISNQLSIDLPDVPNKKTENISMNITDKNSVKDSVKDRISKYQNTNLNKVVTIDLKKRGIRMNQ